MISKLFGQSSARQIYRTTNTEKLKQSLKLWYRKARLKSQRFRKLKKCCTILGTVVSSDIPLQFEDKSFEPKCCDIHENDVIHSEVSENAVCENGGQVFPMLCWNCANDLQRHSCCKVCDKGGALCPESANIYLNTVKSQVYCSHSVDKCAYCKGVTSHKLCQTETICQEQPCQNYSGNKLSDILAITEKNSSRSCSLDGNCSEFCVKRRQLMPLKTENDGVGNLESMEISDKPESVLYEMSISSSAGMKQDGVQSELINVSNFSDENERNSPNICLKGRHNMDTRSAMNVGVDSECNVMETGTLFGEDGCQEFEDVKRCCERDEVNPFEDQEVIDILVKQLCTKVGCKVRIPWYKKLSALDILHIIVLCSHYGFVRISKETGIPKTQLLKWKKLVKTHQIRMLKSKEEKIKSDGNSRNSEDKRNGKISSCNRMKENSNKVNLEKRVNRWNDLSRKSSLFHADELPMEYLKGKTLGGLSKVEKFSWIWKDHAKLFQKAQVLVAEMTLNNNPPQTQGVHTERSCNMKKMVICERKGINSPRTERAQNENSVSDGESGGKGITALLSRNLENVTVSKASLNSSPNSKTARGNSTMSERAPSNFHLHNESIRFSENLLQYVVKHKCFSREYKLKYLNREKETIEDAEKFLGTKRLPGDGKYTQQFRENVLLLCLKVGIQRTAEHFNICLETISRWQTLLLSELKKRSKFSKADEDSYVFRVAFLAKKIGVKAVGDKYSIDYDVVSKWCNHFNIIVRCKWRQIIRRVMLSLKAQKKKESQLNGEVLKKTFRKGTDDDCKWMDYHEPELDENTEKKKKGNDHVKKNKPEAKIQFLENAQVIHGGVETTGKVGNSPTEVIDLETSDDGSDCDDMVEIVSWTVEDKCGKGGVVSEKGKYKDTERVVPVKLHQLVNGRIVEGDLECNKESSRKTDQDDMVDLKQKLHLKAGSINEATENVIIIPSDDSDDDEVCLLSNHRSPSPEVILGTLHIKLERFDEEFDKVEKGIKRARTRDNTEGSESKGNVPVRSHVVDNQRVIKSGFESCNEKQGQEPKHSDCVIVNEMGVEKGKEVEAQSHTFSSGSGDLVCSGSSSSANHGTSVSSATEIGQNSSTADVQIVGLNDLQPGEDYFLLDKKLLSSTLQSSTASPLQTLLAAPVLTSVFPSATTVTNVSPSSFTPSAGTSSAFAPTITIPLPKLFVGGTNEVAPPPANTPVLYPNYSNSNSANTVMPTPPPLQYIRPISGQQVTASFVTSTSLQVSAIPQQSQMFLPTCRAVTSGQRSLVVQKSTSDGKTLHIVKPLSSNVDEDKGITGTSTTLSSPQVGSQRLRPIPVQYIRAPAERKLTYKTIVVDPSKPIVVSPKKSQVVLTPAQTTLSGTSTQFNQASSLLLKQMPGNQLPNLKAVKTFIVHPSTSNVDQHVSKSPQLLSSSDLKSLTSAVNTSPTRAASLGLKSAVSVPSSSNLRVSKQTLILSGEIGGVTANSFATLENSEVVSPADSALTKLSSSQSRTSFVSFQKSNMSQVLNLTRDTSKKGVGKAAGISKSDAEKVLSSESKEDEEEILRRQKAKERFLDLSAYVSEDKIDKERALLSALLSRKTADSSEASSKTDKENSAGESESMLDLPTSNEGSSTHCISRKGATDKDVDVSQPTCQGQGENVVLKPVTKEELKGTVKPMSHRLDSLIQSVNVRISGEKQPISSSVNSVVTVDSPGTSISSDIPERITEECSDNSQTTEILSNTGKMGKNRIDSLISSVSDRIKKTRDCNDSYTSMDISAEGKDNSGDTPTVTEKKQHSESNVEKKQRKGESNVRRDIRDIKKGVISPQNLGEDSCLSKDSESSNSSLATTGSTSSVGSSESCPIELEEEEEEDTDSKESTNVDLSEKLKSLLNADIFNVINTDTPAKSDNDESNDDDCCMIVQSKKVGVSHKEIVHSEIRSDQPQKAVREDEPKINVIDLTANDSNSVVVTTPVSETTVDTENAEKPVITTADKRSFPKTASEEKSAEVVPGRATSLGNMTKNATLSRASTDGLASKRPQYPLTIKKKIGKLASMFSIVSLSRKYGIGSNTISKWKSLYGHEQISALDFTGEELSILQEIREYNERYKTTSKKEYQIYVDNPEEDAASVVSVEEQGNTSGMSDLERSRGQLTSLLQLREDRARSQLISQPSVKTGDIATQSRTPNPKFYIPLDDNTDSKQRQLLRQKFKSQTAISDKSLASQTSSGMRKAFSSIFGEDTPKEKPAEGDDKDGLTLQKVTYLCPEEGIFKFRYILPSPSVCSSPSTLTTTSVMSNPQLKQSQGKNRKTGQEVFSSKLKSDEKYSQKFKIAVVKEARSSGFDKTSKWYNIPMDLLMKWHDNYVHGSGTDETGNENENEPESSISKEPLIEIVGAGGGSQGLAKKKSTKLNVGLSFDKFQNKEGAIMKPRFNMQKQISPGKQPKSRVGVDASASRGNIEQLEQFQADVQGDLGIMPKFVKQNSKSKDNGVEIASTWKQVQSVLTVQKPAEKKYTQEFKNRIIKECEMKGQKTVSQTHKIPYNEISRWRLEARKSQEVKLQTSKPESKTDSVCKISQKKQTNISRGDTNPNLGVFLPSESAGTGWSENKPHENESLKIKIKLPVSSQDKPKVSSKESINKEKENLLVTVKQEPVDDIDVQTMRSELVPGTSIQAVQNRSSYDRGSLRKGKKEIVVLDEDAELRMGVINYCFEHGVLKTQKKFNVTRQSIIDLMKEYDELNKYSVDAYNKEHGYDQLKTKLVSREKTSVEVTNTAQPVIVKNLTDYIVTQEYKQTVVEYAKNHGITAASRKYKRKTSTVRTWINERQREEQKKIAEEQVCKEIELLRSNVPVEDARKISFFEARKKRQQLENEYRNQYKKTVVEFAKKYSITEATKKYKKKAHTIKSWMGYFAKTERDAKKQQDAKNTEAKTSENINFLSPGKQTEPTDTGGGKSPATSQRSKSLDNSPIWEQDFVIKPSSSKSPLKMTFSPRRKSSPVFMSGMYAGEKEDGDNADDVEFDEEETNDIETEDEEEGKQFVEFSSLAQNSSEEPLASHTVSTENMPETSLVVISDDKSPVKKVQGSGQEAETRENDEKELIGADATAKGLPEINEVLFNESIKTVEKSLPSEAEKGDDSLISPNDVPDMSKSGELYRAEENLDGSVQDSEDHMNKNKEALSKPLMSAEYDEELSEEEEILESIPYEDTIMFKVLTSEMEQFFCDKSLSLTKDVSALSRKSKGMGADAEIIANIEETFLFTENRATRNSLNRDKVVDTQITAESNLENEDKQTKEGSIGKPSQEIQGEMKFSDQQEEESISTFTEFGDQNKETVVEETKGKAGSVLETSTKECFVKLAHIEISNKSGNDSANSKKDEAESPKVDFGQKETDDIPISAERKERSIFDFLSTDDMQNKTGDEKNDQETTRIGNLVTGKEEKNETEGKTSTSENRFSLFGNLMKSFSLPSFPTKIVDKSEEAKEVSGIADESDNKNVDKSERNLFDIIAIKDVEPTQSPSKVEPLSQTKSLFKTASPLKRALRSNSRTGHAAAGSSHPVISYKKPMFKFPKLALSVNFGSIAKLGMAKLKEDSQIKSDKEGMDSKSETFQENDESMKSASSTDDGVEITQEGKDLESHHMSEVSEVSPGVLSSVTESVHSKSERNAAENFRSDDTNTSKPQESTSGIVMETFEQLRQRLAHERALAKAEKEKEKEKAVLEHADEHDGNDTSDSGITKGLDTVEEDEMYKEFAPEKIVLILDISKKHGIDFACTSFGLPASVIVNWIIEKDRKQRKVALSLSLEEKLSALLAIERGEINVEDLAVQRGMDSEIVRRWDAESGWLLKEKGVVDVLGKWKKVVSLGGHTGDESKKKQRQESSLEIADGSKQIEEKALDLSEAEEAGEDVNATSEPAVGIYTLVEESIENDNDRLKQTDGDNMQDKPIDQSGPELAKKLEDVEGINVSNVDSAKVASDVNQNADQGKHTSDIDKSVREENKDSKMEIKIPDVLSFAQTTPARDYTIEQKAICVVLAKKYGEKEVCQKLGINPSTLSRWVNKKTVISDLLDEQAAGFRKVKKSLDDSLTDGEHQKDRERQQGLGNSKLNAKKSGDDKDSAQSYRMISPTKIPNVLKNIAKGPTKGRKREFTFEEKVALVKLVELYGVRQVHKQFKIPTGTIWNFQHSKVIKEALKQEQKDKGSFVDAAKQNLESDIEQGDEFINVDAILDRVLANSEAVSDHVNYKLEQKADIVFLVNHYGGDYVCEKLPQIPRGTLWNWRHSRHVLPLVDALEKKVKKQLEKSGSSFVGAMATDTVDKTGMTQKWLKECEATTRSRKRGNRDSSLESFKRQRLDGPEVEGTQGSEVADSDGIARGSTPSSIESDISIHSDEFEEIDSDLEVTSPSVYSKRSGTSTATVKSGSANVARKPLPRNSKSAAGNTGAPEKADCVSVKSGASGKESDNTEQKERPVYEVQKIELGADNRMMVCYKVSNGEQKCVTHPCYFCFCCL